MELITQEQCHTALALVRCPPASQIFQGRKGILDKMQQYFFQDNKKRRVFVLHGLGGSGKTQIALKFLESCNEDERQFFVNASSSDNLTASFVNIAISQGFGKTAEAGHQWLISKARKWTLLFDNADNPKLKLWPFFPQCSHGNIIITSRNPQLAALASPNAHSQVGDLDGEDAASLLLARAVKKHTDETHKLAVAIVRLSCMPLAIVQAGAYIAKFKCLMNYLSIYRQNKEELLRQHPGQTLDNYEGTVYTTWQISFDKLSPVAAQFLQLCALLHHSSIPEAIFANATKWILKNEGNKTESMQEAKEFLQNFVSGSGGWQEQHLRKVVAEIEEYSLLASDETSKTLSMHPLVHLWCSDTQPNQATARECMTNILGMAIDLGPEAYLERIRVIAHVNMLVPDFSMVKCQFWSQYAWIYCDGGKFEQAKGLYELNLERQRELLGKDHPDTLTAMANLAFTYWQLGRYQEAEKLDLSVLEQRQKLLSDDHPETVTAMANLAATYRKLGQYQEAEKLQLSVLKQRQKLLGDDHPDTLTGMANLAATSRKLGQYQEAEKLELSVLKQCQKLLGDDHPDTLTAMANLAATSRELGRYQEAEKLELSVLKQRQKLLGDDHPETVTAMANLAATYWKLGRYQEAEKLQLSVLKQHQKLLGDDHPDMLTAMANLAATYRHLGQSQEAEKLQLSVLKQRQKFLGDDHPDTLAAMTNLAGTYWQLGQHQEAEKFELSVLKQHQKIFGDDHPDTVTAMANLAATSRALGWYQEAEKLELSVLKQRQKLLGDDHPDTLTAMANLAMTLYSTGRHQAAENLQLQVVAKFTQVLGADHPHTLQAIKASKDMAQDALAKGKDAKNTGVKRLSKLFSTFKSPSSKK
ncbi:hypothetical protein FB45DRAFT_336013 [Roridomyces roridus]|uniref:TPR-like protein n=1 Tax=Roridomyces roridus TaxID=1738132 RepID=A0AAD7B530_9AGAR|nr:hypothetical protein FB45DRAFT_336013 [Roridomyces roridus]